MSRVLKLVVAEPSEIIRSGVASVLRTFPGPDVDVFEAGDLTQLGPLLARHKPDILLVNPAALSGWSLPQLREQAGCASMKCIALQVGLADAATLRAFDEAVSIYDTAEQIRTKIVRMGEREPVTERQEPLSVREREIVVCIVKGMTNKQIADHLCISTHTVITHRRNIVGKLRIHSSAGLTIYAIVNRLVELSEVRDTITEI